MEIIIAIQLRLLEYAEIVDDDNDNDKQPEYFC